MIALFMFSVGRRLVVAAARRELFEAHYGWGGTAWTGRGWS